jgi:hypothetical protein
MKLPGPWTLLVALPLLLAVPGRAAVLNGDCRVQLEFLDNGQATFVVVTVIPPRAMEVDADVSIIVNGQLVKVEPILSRTLTTIVAPAGPTGATLRACVDVAGVLRTSLNRLSPASARACGTRNPESTETWPPLAFGRTTASIPSLTGAQPPRAPLVLRVRSR